MVAALAALTMSAAVVSSTTPAAAVMMHGGGFGGGFHGSGFGGFHPGFVGVFTQASVPASSASIPALVAFIDASFIGFLRQWRLGQQLVGRLWKQLLGLSADL